MPPKRTPRGRKVTSASAPVRLSLVNGSAAPSPATPAPAPTAHPRPAPVPTRQTRFERDGEEYVLVQEYIDGGVRVTPVANERRVREYAARNATKSEEGEGSQGEEEESGGEEEEAEAGERLTGYPGNMLKPRKVTQQRVSVPYPLLELILNAPVNTLQIKWTAENDARLLLFGLERVILSSEMQAIADSFPGSSLTILASINTF